MQPHIPVVRIKTIQPDEKTPAVPGVLTEITVDGEAWAITDYQVHGSSRDFETVTLTFYADVTIEHHRRAGDER